MLHDGIRSPVLYNHLYDSFAHGGNPQCSVVGLVDGVHIFHFGSIGLHRQFFQLAGRVGVIVDSVFRAYPKSVFAAGCEAVDGVVGQCTASGDKAVVLFRCIVGRIVRYAHYAAAFGPYP